MPCNTQIRKRSVGSVIQTSWLTSICTTSYSQRLQQNLHLQLGSPRPLAHVARRRLPPPPLQRPRRRLQPLPLNSSFFEIKQGADDSGSSPRSKNKHTLALGLGLGLGIPLLILLTSLAAWFCVQRRRRRATKKREEEAASQNGALLVDWKATQPPVSPDEGWRQDGNTTNAELGGDGPVEMSGATRLSEAPSNPARSERVELEGDSRRD